MRLIICRHGKTEWNIIGRKQGQRVDSPLSEEGRETARSTGEALKDLHIDAVYVSPLGRALASAEIILKGRKIKQEKEPLLVEMGLGDLEGMTVEEMHRKAPEFFAVREKDFFSYYNTPYPNGESYADVEKRARKFVEMLGRKHGVNETVLAVCHQGIGRVVVGCAAAVEQSKIPPIGFPNEVYYSIDTETRKTEWHNVKSCKKGEGLLERET